MTMADIVLLDGNGVSSTYTGKETVTIPTPDGGEQVFETQKVREHPTVELDFSAGDTQEVTPSEGAVLDGVTINRPETLVPGNIAKDVDIGGVIGTYEGGGVVGTGAYHVEVIDYDGKTLSEAYLDKSDVFTLPDAPVHDRLVFDGWSSPEEIIDGAITIGNSDVIIVAKYHTVSGATEFDVEMTLATDLTFTFRSVITPTSIDWGDGKTDSTLTHKYTAPGEYTIKAYGIKSIASGSSVGGVVVSGSSGNEMYKIKRVFLAEGVTSIGTYAFLNCRNLTSITLPGSLIRINNYAFSGCYNLSVIAIPDKVTIIGQYAFAYCYSLRCVNISKSMTYIGSYAFNANYRFTSITIPDNVTSIRANAFSNCYNLKVYDFSKHTKVPTLSSNGITGQNLTCRMLIPSALYSTWKTTTNWKNFVNYMVPV